MWPVGLAALSLSFLFVIDLLIMFSCAPYVAFGLDRGEYFARSPSCALRSRPALRCRTLGQSRPRPAGHLPLMGKALLRNISVPPRLCCRPKTPCYGLFVGCGSPIRDPSLIHLAVLSARTVTAAGACTLLTAHPAPIVVLCLGYTQSWYCTCSVPEV